MLWKDKTIYVVGDIMLDHYLRGTADRVSPEAAVLVIRKTGDDYVAGGAANTAANVAALGATAHLYGVIGQDMYGDRLLQELDKLKINHRGVVEDTSRPTSIKTRVTATNRGNQQIVRIDDESTKLINSGLEGMLTGELVKQPHPVAVVISDYAKGVVTPTLTERLINFGREQNIPVIIDPKPLHHQSYHNAFLITPNRHEAGLLYGTSLETELDIFKAGTHLAEKFLSHVLITLGEEGMVLFERGQQPYHIPTEATQVSDVSGAGDTVVATIAVGLAGNMSLVDAVKLANKAAGLKVRKSGTAPVSYSELFPQST